ncbi:MAG: ParB N-terminal domain-containing protein [Candidatus Poseidoniaceae archaeon]|nr:ParB N-terminal domain-containing protein [Candidatus Poseidoniaceae archaeon]
MIGNVMAWDESDVRLVPLEWLKPHEEIKVKNMKKLLDMTLRWNGFTKPLIVDKATGVILDGHHRHAVAMRLELARIPVIVVDYFDNESIDIELWPASELEEITKQDVIDMALSDHLYPPKTTRHRIADYLPPIHVSLEKLSLLSPTTSEESE